MAIIGKIREKSWLILIIVGGALLAFILTDYQKMTGNTEFKYGYGTVYGEKVDIDAFNNEVALAQYNSDMMADQQGQPRTAVDRNQVWTAFVEEIVLEKEMNALGIDVSAAEFDAYLYGKNGFPVMQDLAEQFRDSITGMFNEKLLQARIEEMEASDDPNVQSQWEASKEYYTNKRKQEKYYDILKQGMYVTNLEAKNEYYAQKEVKSISFVLKRYSEIKDAEIDTSEEKLKAYFEEHKNDKKYENKIASREVRFFDITIEPSSEDSARFEKLLTDLKEGFRNTKNDSLFVMKNSDMKVFSSTHLATFKPQSDEKARQGATYPDQMDTVFKAASIGDVIGPYEDQGTTRIAKILDFNRNSLTARHILIAAQRADEAAVAKAKKKTDSLMALVNKDNFEDFVRRFSDDPGSKDKGGKYENFMDYEMVPEFSEFAANEPIGKIGYVQTDFGFHIMEVLERKPVNNPVLAIIQKTLKASQTTIDEKEMEVDKLIYTLNDELAEVEDPKKKLERFDTIVNQAGYFARSINIEENSPKVYGFNSKVSEDKILELAFREEAAVGDLVSAPIKENNRYIIAILSSIKEKGTPKYEDVEPAILRDYIQAQKVKMLTAKMIKGKSLSDLSKSLNVPVQNAEVTFANPQISGAGMEPAIVGAVFSGLKDGARTMPLEGKFGVFVVQLDKTTKVPAAANYMVEKDQLQQALVGNIQGTSKRALIKMADVVDNRRFFDANIRR